MNAFSKREKIEMQTRDKYNAVKYSPIAEYITSIDVSEVGIFFQAKAESVAEIENIMIGAEKIGYSVDNPKASGNIRNREYFYLYSYNGPFSYICLNAPKRVMEAYLER